MFRKILFYAMFSIIFFSCTKSTVYEDNYVFENGIWNENIAAGFKVNIENPEQPVDVFIDFENTKDYLSSNIWLLINVVSPSGKSQRERVEYTLTEPNGKWLGEIGSNSVRNRFLFKNNISFPEKGQYIFTISQIMRENFTPRAKSVGLFIYKAKIVKSKNSEKK